MGNEPMGGYQSAMSGNPATGKALIQSYGCGSCHLIPGIRTARGMVGPPLLYYSRRAIIAGELPNTPPNLVAWIKDPVAIEPGTAMPNLGVTGKTGSRHRCLLVHLAIAKELYGQAR